MQVGTPLDVAPPEAEPKSCRHGIAVGLDIMHMQGFGIPSHQDQHNPATTTSLGTLWLPSPIPIWQFDCLVGPCRKACSITNLGKDVTIQTSSNCVIVSLMISRSNQHLLCCCFRLNSLRTRSCWPKTIKTK